MDVMHSQLQRVLPLNSISRKRDSALIQHHAWSSWAYTSSSAFSQTVSSDVWLACSQNSASSLGKTVTSTLTPSGSSADSSSSIFPCRTVAQSVFSISLHRIKWNYTRERRLHRCNKLIKTNRNNDTSNKVMAIAVAPAMSNSSSR